MRFLFGDYVLATARRELSRGGEQIALEPQVFDLLVYLLQNREHVVSKDDLLASVWGGRIVSDATLDSRIKAARRAVGDSGAVQNLIRTFARKGVRFVGEVREEAKPTALAQEMAAEPGQAVAAPRLSIVVLPFANLSNDADQEYFADGITDDLTTDLSLIPGSFVIARSTAFTYKAKGVDAKQVGRELGVRYVLEGSVRRSGNQVRVNTQLIDAETGAHLWAERFDRDTGDLSALQDEITGHVARILKSDLARPVEPRAGLRKTVDFNLADPGAGYKRAEQLQQVETSPSSVGRGPVADPGHVPQGHPERRLVTVLSCGIAGLPLSTSELDPEEVLANIAALHHVCAEVIGRRGGFVARFHSDGLLAYFGYQQAHEDDAERAVRAGLALVDAIRRFEMPDRLRARIGISTGIVVVGDLIGEGEGQERSIVGETPKLAAMLQALAEPDAIVIGDGTRHQVGARFEVADLGPQQLRGVGAPQRTWQILSEREGLSRFEALRSRDTPLVGREEEMEVLGRRWAQAKAGAGRVVLISGEPGIGKSRLAEAFREYIVGDPHTRLRYFCSPHHQDSALFPIIAQLERAADFERGDAPEVKLDKLEALIATSAAAEGDVPLLAELLSLPVSDRYPTFDLTPQRKKEKIFAALLHQLGDLGRRRPVLMIFEDLHWADPTSRELLDLIVEQLERSPVLLIATFRPEFQQPWTGQPHVTTLSLRRLGRDESDELVRGIVGNIAALPSEVVEEIVERSDGVPLFLEELTKAVLETATAKTECGSPAVSTSLAVPATLHASLMARLDRLGPMCKEIAQVGAAIGRDFSYELLAGAAQRTEAELRDALGRLVDAGLVLQRGVLPEATFLFKHALVQDTAYGMLLRGPRHVLHARIARALVERYPSVEEIQPQILARHFTEAGLLEKAVTYWCRAGQQSAAKSALVEAVAQLRRGLRLVADLPETREHKQQERDLHIALAGTLVWAKGFAHPEVVQAFGRARSLVLETGATGSIPHFAALHGLVLADFIGGKPKEALEQAKEFLSLAQYQKDSGLELAGHRLVGTTLIAIGDYPPALSHLEHAMALYAPQDHREMAFRFGADIDVMAFCYYTLALWHAGYPDQASKAAREALRDARRSVHHHTLAWSLVGIGMTAISARRAAEMEELGSEAVAVTTEYGFPLYLGWGLILQGWALAQRGQGRVAVERIRRGTEAIEATGARVHRPIYLGLLAEALALTGNFEEGLAVLAEALATADASRARGNDAELHRLWGDLLRRSPSPDWTTVEASFRKALAVAREQGTRGFELRAAVSLARLLSDQGRWGEANDVLAPVYGSFTEGFDTPEFKEAQALLAALE